MANQDFEQIEKSSSKLLYAFDYFPEVHFSPKCQLDLDFYRLIAHKHEDSVCSGLLNSFLLLSFKKNG